MLKKVKKIKNIKKVKREKVIKYFQKIHLILEVKNLLILVQLKAKLEILIDNKVGEALKDNEKTFIENVLIYHHNYDDKIKFLDFITMKSEKFEYSRYFYIVKKESEKVDFSIKKCINELYK